MKTVKLLVMALLAAFSFHLLPPAPAKADHLRWLLPGFPPPPSRRVYRYYPEPYEGDFYEDDYDDEVYYDYEEDSEPRYEPKPRKKKKSMAPVAPQVKSKPAQKAKKKPVETASAPQLKKTAAPASVSCDKAKSIVTGYGFGDVQTRSCSGSMYSFAATRGGKSFSVKVSALNGELTEVKRQ